MSKYDQLPDQHGANHAGAKNSVQTQLMEEHLARTLQRQAEHVHFSPALRTKVLQEVARYPRGVTARKRAVSVGGLRPAFALVLAFVILLLVGTLIYSFVLPHGSPGPGGGITFISDRTLETPSELAHNGSLVAVDPTGHYLVYGNSTQTGVMYTTDLRDPIVRNTLAMRDARDASWATDGSALAATVYPETSDLPLLALVRTGGYMAPLQTGVLATGWRAKAQEPITYITWKDGQTILWGKSADGKTTRQLAVLPLKTLSQVLRWSPDGRYLAILTTEGTIPTRAALEGPGRALFLFDTQTQKLSELVTPGPATIGEITWAPNSQLLTYETSTMQKQVTLHTEDVKTLKAQFTLSLNKEFEGMSWSPDSQMLTYSDGGTLHAHALTGSEATFQISGTATHPFWLDRQHILYLAIDNGVGTLVQLKQQMSN